MMGHPVVIKGVNAMICAKHTLLKIKVYGRNANWSPKILPTYIKGQGTGALMQGVSPSFNSHLLNLPIIVLTGFLWLNLFFRLPNAEDVFMAFAAFMSSSCS